MPSAALLIVYIRFGVTSPLLVFSLESCRGGTVLWCVAYWICLCHLPRILSAGWRRVGVGWMVLTTRSVMLYCDNISLSRSTSQLSTYQRVFVVLRASHSMFSLFIAPIIQWCFAEWLALFSFFGVREVRTSWSLKTRSLHICKSTPLTALSARALSTLMWCKTLKELQWLFSIHISVLSHVHLRAESQPLVIVMSSSPWLTQIFDYTIELQISRFERKKNSTIQ